MVLEILQWLVIISTTALNWWYMRKVHGSMGWYKDNWNQFNRKVRPAEYVNQAVVDLSVGVNLLAEKAGLVEEIKQACKEKREKDYGNH